MATTNKDFKVKNGLIVEGANATVAGNEVLTNAASINALSDVTISSPTSGQVLKWNGSAWVNDTDATGGGGGGGISNVVEDTTPQLGGDLDAQNFDITNLNSVTLTTSPTSPGTGAGTIFWDSGDGIPKAVLNANVTIGLGQESIITVKNATGSTITKGTVVYINGAQGQMPTIALANAATEGTSSKTFGFVAEQILDDAEGFVVTEGVLRGVNTDTFTEGDPIYLSTTAGQYTQTIPEEPAHMVFLGYAVKAHASAGEVIVKIQNGYELTELHGVTIANTAATNDILQLNSSGIWVNANLATAGIANLSGATFTGDISSTNANISGNVTAATFTGSGSGLTSIPAANISGTVAVANGGTGAANATDARANLGAATVFTQTTEPAGGAIGDIWIDTDSSVTPQGVGYVPAGGPIVYTTSTNTSDYSTTYTPTAGTRAIRFTVVGGGGGGAGANATATTGGGGGAGAYAMTWTTSIAASYAITVGGAGSGGSAGGAGTNGNTSSVITNLSVTTASAGGGSAAPAGSDAGVGSTTATGTITSGGGSGVPAGGGPSGSGGASFFGGGGRGGGVPGNFTGEDAPAYGAGGGGGRYSNANRSGGAGKAGIIIVEEFV